MIECHVGHYRETWFIGPVPLRQRVKRRGKVMVFYHMIESLSSYRYEVMP